MRVKTVATGCNRKQLKTKCLELAALVEWKGVQLLAIDIENRQLVKENKELKSKFDVQGKILKDTTDKLVEQKRITDEIAQGAEEMTKGFYGKSKEINRLDDVLVAANAELDRRDTIISNLNNTVSSLQLKVIELSSENEQLKKPFWKKVKGCLVK